MDLATGGFLAAIVLGFLLGLRHATDADHVVAVSTIVSEERNAWRGLWVGASWGLGHTTPLLGLGVLILLLRGAVMDRYEAVAPLLEFGVGIMLVFLGVQVFWRLRKQGIHVHYHSEAPQRHVHVHTHESGGETVGDPRETHRVRGPGRPFLRVKSYVVGVVHGLAGSAAVMLLLLPQAPSFIAGIVYILLFGLGTMMSMSAITLILGIPFAATARVDSVNRWVARIAASISLVLGVALMSDIAIGTQITGFVLPD